jgi:hypothetical protein
MATLSAQGNLSEARPTPHAYKRDGMEPRGDSDFVVFVCQAG